MAKQTLSALVSNPVYVVSNIYMGSIVTVIGIACIFTHIQCLNSS